MSLRREIESFGTTLLVDQDFGGELGATVWDAALVLCKFFENLDEFPRGHFKNKKIIELGAGTGCVGLILSQLGGNVTLTDQKQMLPLLQHNAKLNNLDKRVQVVEYNWGEQPENITPPYGYSSSYQALIDALWWLTSSSSNTTNSPLIIMSYEKRSIKEKEFFDLLRTKFTCEKLDNSKLDPMFQSDDIGIFYIKRKPAP